MQTYDEFVYFFPNRFSTFKNTIHLCSFFTICRYENVRYKTLYKVYTKQALSTKRLWRQSVYKTRDQNNPEVYRITNFQNFVKRPVVQYAI